MITPGGGLAVLSDGLVKWKTAQTAAVDQSFFGSIDASFLPEGRYGLHLLVVPAVKLGKAFYYYQSEMIIH